MKTKFENQKADNRNGTRNLFRLLLVYAFYFPLSAFAATPFSYQFYNSDGSPQTNTMTMTAWPPSTNAWTIYGTNIIWGSQSITLMPNTNGYGTNFAFPNNYRVLVSNLNSGFFIQLPDTSNQIALGTCLVSAPQVAGPLGFYALITNWLGFTPATNGLAALTNTLTDAALTGIHGYRSATNGLAALTNTLTDDALVGIHAYRPATNGLNALTNTLTDAALVSVHGYRPATNGLAALTNTLTDVALTVIHGYRPATNGLAALTNTLTDAALVGIHAYRPATNGLAALTNILTDAALVSVHGYRPATNGLSPLTNTLTGTALGGILGYKPATNQPLLLTTNLTLTIPGGQTNTLFITNGIPAKLTNP